MEHTFHYLLLCNQAILHKKLLTSLSGTGLTLGQPKILDYLVCHDGASQKEIAAACHMEAGSLSSVITGMESKGLIERRRKGQNKRTFHVYLTEEGARLSQIVTKEFEQLESQAMQGIGEEEQKLFMDTFLKIHNNLLHNSIETE